ncbi:hypothetical protein ACRDNQ_02645 [Palleronia sp. KMU-117]|uniref:hypothetical protein n=1 Tax=Palleronia sp. KMU-117 TaxID=3434108 RepID=UPI003D752F80
MIEYEYRVIPAPAKPARGKADTSAGDGFLALFSELLNDMGREGWIYVRTDVVTERRGRWPFLHRTETRELVVFQRPVQSDPRPLLLTHQVEGPSTAAAPLPVPVPPDAVARPASETTAIGVAEAMSQARARRVTRPEAVERVRAGARRIAMTPPAARAPRRIATAAE